ncbi:MAG TPA: arginine N-succinyltransferase [Gammaproteobacteria bacterium]|nr:arginine N-succinyltransferase [Gammaproteobacteria bacterium]
MSLNYVFRPIQESDMPAILEIAEQKGAGFNSLPNDAKVMQAKIIQSINSFSEKLDFNKRYYFFVLENSDTQEMMGSASIETNLGYLWPFYKYKISTLVQISKALNQHKEHQILSLVTEHQGATELGALYLKPAYRGEGRGTFLSRARCLFIAEFLNNFSEKIVADMRGMSNQDEISPFWEAIGHYFADIPYSEASHLKATKGSQFLVDLMPHLPIYIDLLPEIAKKVIGKVHKNTAPALHVLEKEGFQFKNHVDIFDAGVTIEAEKLHLKTVRESKKAALVAFKDSVKKEPTMMISNTKHSHFRAVVGALEELREKEIALSTAVAKQLQISVGDKLRYCSLR